jgi:predicted site-specific integrase-resolvase
VPPDPDQDDQKLLTTSAVAKEFGISRQTLARYAADGTLEPAVVLPSGHLRWRIEDVRRQLAELRRRGSEQED